MQRNTEERSGLVQSRCHNVGGKEDRRDSMFDNLLRSSFLPSWTKSQQGESNVIGVRSKEPQFGEEELGPEEEICSFGGDGSVLGGPLRWCACESSWGGAAPCAVVRGAAVPYR